MGDVDSGGPFGGWGLYVDDDGARHVVPEDDLRGHKVFEKCWCEPLFDGEITVHNSMDGREMFERGERRVN